MTDDDDQRDAVMMMASNGLTVKRISMALGLSVAEVERLLQQRAPDDTTTNEDTTMDFDEIAIDDESVAPVVDLMSACGICGDAAVAPGQERTQALQRGMSLLKAAKTLAGASADEVSAFERVVAHLRGLPARQH